MQGFVMIFKETLKYQSLIQPRQSWYGYNLYSCEVKPGGHGSYSSGLINSV